MTRAELREVAIQMILAEVGKGYTIDEAVKRITTRPRSSDDPMRSQKIITVCGSCLTETCLQTSLKCSEAATAGTITDTEERIAAMTPKEESFPNITHGLEIIGPFNDYRVTVDGYEVPRLRAVRVNGLISMTLDHRFGCDIPDDNRAHSIIWFIANVMAVGAGYSCFGENARPANPFKCRLTGINLSQIEDGTTQHFEEAEPHFSSLRETSH